ncbi:MAG: c-type cytochrome domain-containing protein, partial [Planctomycetaceae bacterium]
MKVHRYIRCFMTCAAILAVEASSADEGLYLQKIKPLLQKRCLTCHGALRQEAGLRLDTAVAARTGSENGAVLNPETPATSLLLRRVTSRDPDDRMPPEGDPLGDRQI